MDPTDIEKRLKKIEDILFNTTNDNRFKAKVRKQIFDGEHATGKPTVVNENGKRYKLQIV